LFVLCSEKLSELEPDTVKSDPRQQTTVKRVKRAKRETTEKQSAVEKKDDFISQARRVAHDADSTLPSGRGLNKDGRKLFAVQHRGTSNMFG